MRDFQKDKIYFSNFIKETNQRVIKFEKLLAELQKSNPEDDGLEMRGSIILAGIYREKFIALYSSGEEINNEMKEVYFKWLEKAEIVSNDEYSYVDLLWLVSIAILLDLQEELSERLSAMAKKLKMNDGFIEYLLNPSAENLKNLSFFMAKPYSEWGKIVTAPDHKKITLIKKYLTSKWYRSHDEEGWYDSHLFNEDIYSGYWSFESGAMVKVLGLDDSELKDVPYYPYDLVHAGNQK